MIRNAKLEQDLAAVKMQAASDTARWREEVSLKQAHVDMLLAGDAGKEAEFMTQRVKDLQVSSQSIFNESVNSSVLRTNRPIDSESIQSKFKQQPPWCLQSSTICESKVSW